jgi:hypothetical protein
MLNVTKKPFVLSVIKLNVIILSVVAPIDLDGAHLTLVAVAVVDVALAPQAGVAGRAGATEKKII